MGQLLFFRLRRLGLNVSLIPSGGSEVLEGIAHAGKGDLVITFGFGKLSEESRMILSCAKTAGFRTMAFYQPPLCACRAAGRYQSLCIPGRRGKYHSSTAAAAVADALVLAVSEQLKEASVGGRQEAGVGHLEQQLRRGVILHQQGEGPIVRRARGGADPLGYLLLDQHRQGLKAAAFHHPGQQRGGDVIRQVGAQNGPQAPKVLPHQGRQLLLHHVAPDQGEIGDDLLFDAQNEKLRRFLTEKMQIKVIARLGEKIFEEVNRATTVIVCRKEKPVKDSVTHCFRLTTEERRKFLNSNQSLLNFYNEDVHDVLQGRFAENAACNFDVDTRTDEEALLAKIKKQSISWDDTFIFGRGVEISKTGKVVFCPSCGYAQGYKKSQMAEGKKECTNCGSEISVTTASVQNVISKSQTSQTVQIYVGENVRRYGITGECYIKPNIPGINYKNRAMYNPPKLLVRKTGLGIYASIDYTGSMTSQTVYILKFKNSQHKAPLEYYLALLNSLSSYSLMGRE